MVTWIIFKKTPLGGRPNIKLGDHGTQITHNRWFILFYHAWARAWMEIHWNSIWLRAQSRTTSHYTWGSVTTLHGFEGVLGRPLDTLHGHNSWLMCEVALRATSHMSQEPCPCNGEDPCLSSKGRTMGVGKGILCSLGPSSIVWSENEPCCGTITYLPCSLSWNLSC